MVTIFNKTESFQLYLQSISYNLLKILTNVVVFVNIKFHSCNKVFPQQPLTLQLVKIWCRSPRGLLHLNVPASWGIPALSDLLRSSRIGDLNTDLAIFAGQGRRSLNRIPGQFTRAEFHFFDQTKEPLLFSFILSITLSDPICLWHDMCLYYNEYILRYLKVDIGRQAYWIVKN